MQDDEEEFERFYQEAYGDSDIGRRRIRDVFSREDARYLFDQMKLRRLTQIPSPSRTTDDNT